MAKPTMVDEQIVKNSDGSEEKVVVKYWSCPIKFVPNSIWEFVKIKNFYELHPSSPFPKYGDVSPRYIQAENTLERELMLAREEMQK